MIFREVLTQRKQGQNSLRTVLEMNEPAARLLVPAQRRKLYKFTLERVMRNWRTKYLGRRVNADTVKKPPFNYQKGGNTPMIGWRRKWDKSKLINAMWAGKITAQIPTPKKETEPMKFGVRVAFPLGHAVNSAITKVFKELPSDEINWIVAEWAKELATERSQLVEQKKGKNKGRMVFSPEQRKRLANPPRKLKV